MTVIDIPLQPGKGTNQGNPCRPLRAGARWTGAALAALLVLITGCHPGHRADSPSAPAPTRSPAVATPTVLPSPTGPPLTAALASTPHFLLSLAGSLGDLSSTAIEGQSLDRASDPNAVLPGAPLTAGDAVYAPALSRDHKKVVYVEAPVATLRDPANDGGGELVVQNIDGTGGRVAATGDNASPAWSPDGTQIAFIRSNALWVMRADGSNQHALGVPLSVNFHLSWSPDGTRIAVAAGSPSAIQVVTLATLAITPVGNAPEEDQPSWAPDGQHIVFHETATNSLAIADLASGAGVTQLTTCTSPCQGDLEPAWSPDGAVIAFVRYAPGDASYGREQIWVVPADGGAPERVTSGPIDHAFPNW